MGNLHSQLIDIILMINIEQKKDLIFIIKRSKLH